MIRIVLLGLLMPVMVAFGIVRPLLSLGAWVFLACYGFLYLSPGWSTPEFTSKVLVVGLVCLGVRATGDVLQRVI